MQFEGFEKIGRLSKKGIVTEKIDGTNAQIMIVPRIDLLVDKEAEEHNQIYRDWSNWYLTGNEQCVMFAGSRNRWLKCGSGRSDDNFGFAAWVLRNAEELFKLGQGKHFGEWWGQGIGRNYGLDHRRFSLFNTARWGSHNPNTPSCCHVVPVLRACPLDEVDDVMAQLKAEGSEAAPGFMNPEGVVFFYERQLFKKTYEYDNGKWNADSKVPG